MNEKTNLQEKLIAYLLLISLILGSFITSESLGSKNVYAEEEPSIKISIGVPGLPIELKYGDQVETKTTDQKGEANFTELYKYVDNLGWTADGFTEDKEVKVAYAINYPGKTPLEREELSGSKEYMGSSGDFTLTSIQKDTGKYFKKSIALKAPQKEHVLKYTVKKLPANKDKTKATIVSNITVSLSNGMTGNTDERGEVSFYGIEKDSGISLTIEEKEEYTGFTDTLNNINSVIYVKERETASSKDYKVEGAVNGYVKKPDADTEYTVRGKNGAKLALSIFDSPEDEITITLKPNGSVTPFFVVKNNQKTKKIRNGLKIDDTSPVITQIETKGTKTVKVKEHGIYAKKKADLLITVSVKDLESGVKSLTLIGKDEDGTEEAYSVLSEKKVGSRTEATFIIESKKEMLKKTLYLRAKDNVGNVSNDVLIRGNKDASNITMEIVPPEITKFDINSKINKNGWTNKLPEYSLSYKDSESGLESMKLTLNGNIIDEKSFSKKELKGQTCNGKITKEMLEKAKNNSGEYVFLATVIDNSGNIKTEKKSVKIDLDAPVLNINCLEKGRHYISVPEVSIKEYEEYPKAAGNYFEILVLRDGNPIYRKKVEQLDSFNIPERTFSSDGNYEVKVSGEDAAGNVAKDKSISFIKDSTAPNVSLSGVTNGSFYNSTKTVSISVTERNFSTNKVNISVTKEKGGNRSVECFPWANTDTTSTSNKSFSATGTYRVSVYAVDKAGNRSETKSIVFTVDREAPVINISGITEKIYVYDDIVAPKITITDDYFENSNISITRAGISWLEKLPRSGSQTNISFSDFKKVKENDGSYVLTVTAVDKAGNRSEKTVRFVVNRFGSSYKYNKAINRINNKAKKNIIEDLEILEYNVSPLEVAKNEVKHDGKAIKSSGSITDAGTKDGFNVTKHSFPKELFEKEGVYELNVFSKDKAGNSTEAAEDAGKIKFIVDRTNPVLSISGFKKVNHRNSLPVIIKSKDNLTNVMLKAYISGEEQVIKKNENGETYILLGKGFAQNVKVEAIDSAGNKEVVNKTISVVPNGFLYFLAKYAYWIVAFVVALIAIFATKRYKDKKEGGNNA